MTPEEEQAALDRKNAAFRENPSPGFQGRGSTPDSDAANLSISRAMDRADIGNRFGFGSPQYRLGIDAPTEVLRARRDPSELIDNAITSRRALIHQGIDPDRPALYVSPKRQAELLHENLVEGEQSLRESQVNAVAATHAYHQQKDIDASNDLQGLIQDLHGIKFKIGTPEYANAADEIGLNHIDAIHGTKLGADLFKAHTQIHDQAAATRQAIDDYRKATGKEPESVETTATGGVNIRGGSSAAAKPIPSSVIQRYAALQADLAGHPVAAAAEAEKNTAAKLANRPYSQSALWATQEKEAAVLEKHYPGLKETAAPEDKYVPGKQYKDANGNTATYLGAGKWQ